MSRAGTLAALRRAYAEGGLHPREVACEALHRAAGADPAVWIHRLEATAVLAHVDRLDGLDFDSAPLWGVPFAIKDNIDLAGDPTTAGCPGYAYMPERSATVVERLLAAGAVPIGKTNLDQFATGLVGTRSPYGVVPNAIDPSYIAGGSSSGSAVAVALGIVPFALGTDTAGSGRVPAAFNGLVGFKPSRGWWSTRGVVPACRTLDCVSVFARTVADAYAVAEVAGGFDAEDPFSRRLDVGGFDAYNARFGYLAPERLPWFDDTAYADLYGHCVSGLPGTPRAVDPETFLAAGRLLYEGPWLAERVAAVGDFVDAHPDAVHPVTRTVIEGGRTLDAADCFRAQYRLAELRREADAAFAGIDVLVAPTAPTHYTVDEVEADPFNTNARLGAFTNCVNLLDLCAVAVPAGTTPGGLPFGVTLLAPAGRDYALLRAAAAFLGEEVPSAGEPLPGMVHLAVCGAHMAGQALNGELTRRGAWRVAATRTAPRYRLLALPDGKRPALIRSESGGAPIELEVWSVPSVEVGGFLATVDRPLALGSVELEDGRWVHGFVGDAGAASGAADITRFGGWRAYRETA
ncbi:MAG: allophanate hydrolase [Gammaproteobacteria bacterium]|nr:allophanate hydrolase [Gammaproteobacteria bacterium]